MTLCLGRRQPVVAGAVIPSAARKVAGPISRSTRLIGPHYRVRAVVPAVVLTTSAVHETIWRRPQFATHIGWLIIGVGMLMLAFVFETLASRMPQGRRWFYGEPFKPGQPPAASRPTSQRIMGGTHPPTVGVIIIEP